MAESFAFSKVKNALVIGAGRGIGLAVARRLLADSPQARVWATYRDPSRADALLAMASERLIPVRYDPLDDPEAIREAMAIDRLDFCLNCVGLLHDDEVKPEKRLADIRLEDMLRVFSANTFVTPLVARALWPLLKNPKPAVFAAISAKVGSIGDNRLGGWYSYRASKAALNMMLKSIALELERHHANTIVLALHPGTTKTELSAPFTKKSKLKLHTPEETARNLMSVISGVSPDQNGSFFSWDGAELPW